MGARHPGQDRYPEDQPAAVPCRSGLRAYGEEVRLLLYGKRYRKYRVLFAIRGDVVHVVTVRHAAQRSLREELGGDDADEASP
jgi:hypothetical protein